MSLRTVVDVAVLFENFRNIDLFHQGLYHLRCRIKHESGGDEWTAAIPYGHNVAPLLSEQIEQVKPKIGRIDHHNVIAAQLVEEQEAFVTRTFLIRYCEEEVEIQDTGLFRLEIDIRPGKPTTLAMLLQVELMFADLGQHGGADGFGENADLTSMEFKRVSTQTFRVLGAAQCLHEFCPVVFDEFHFCVANMVVQTALLDVRFRLLPSLVTSTGAAPPPGAQGGNSSPAEGPTTNCAPSVPNLRCESLTTQQDGEESVPMSLMEFIFGCGVDKEAPDSGAWRSSPGGLLLAAESFCQFYLDILSKSHRQLMAWFKELCLKCLTPAQRETLADDLEMPPAEGPFDTFLSLLGDPTSPVAALSGDTEHNDCSIAKEGSAIVNGHGRGQQLRVFFADHLGGKVTAQALSALIAYNLNAVSMQLLTLWHSILDVASIGGRELVALLRTSWEQQAAEDWKKCIIRQVVLQDLGAITDDTDIALLHNGNQRASNRIIGLEALKDDANPIVERLPILLEQRYASRIVPGQKNGVAALQPFNESIPAAPRQYRGLHLFVLVHGFQGNSFDMRLMKNNLALIFPDAIFLMSNVNEDNTEGDMSEMGIRLAQEVVNFISDWCPGSALGRLSFIAYSIGGLILRAALPLLKEYKDKMFTFLSYSTPHLGYMDQQSPLFNAVVWSLKKWRKIRCLDQLTMTDTSDAKESFLYKLSSSSGLEHFKWVVVVSSKQDNYAPYKSSRVEVCPSWNKNANKEAYSSMVQNFWEGIQHERVLRLSVHFDLPERNLDKAIGRAAHIKFIENQSLMRMIIHSYSFLFA